MKEWTKPEVYEVSLEAEEDVLVDCFSSTSADVAPACGQVGGPACWLING